MSMMLTFRAGKLAALIISLAVLGACSREQQDWRSAEAADTVQGYGQFLQRHPDSELATEARTRVAQLSEDLDWQHAGSADNAEAYKQFLAQHPDGKWAQEARIRIENFALGTEGSATTATVSGAVPQAAAPTSTPVLPGAVAQAAAPTQTSPAIATAWRSDDGFAVQLGAFASENAATNEWQQLTVRFNAELHGLAPRVVSANTSTGRLFRLQTLVTDEARARALCDMLKKQSQACVPVLPH
jgi:cell division septation protein DedD